MPMDLSPVRKDIDSLHTILGRPHYALLFAALSTIVILAYWMLTGILVPSTLAFNPLLKPLDSTLITAIAALTALMLTVTAFRFRQHDTRNLRKRTLAGSALGLFTTACPVCQPIWLVWLGLGASTLFLVELSAYLEVASVIAILFSLHWILQTTGDNTCRA
ncbi:hypothetical protein HY995_02350 [Candidatus Micrarchaeota archaeon]|nr:hypothetical protein [Candidatus Micrarchaeota archaeon]MBI5176909.1 hypothetical protein [Candidatus Micrarchaeota archaeon]